MPLKTNRNAIFSGYIDAFCLVCETLIASDDEVEKHMSSRSHIKNLESVKIVEKLKDDQIIKVKKGYYCMLCNLIFTTLTKVYLHVVETEHKISRGSGLLKRTGSLIRFGDVVIDEKAWHGLAGDMCAVCNVDIDDDTEHLADSTHALNLIKNKVEFDGRQIHRKIDDTTFQCITCNSVLALSHLATHFTDPEHENLLLKRINDYKDENVQKPQVQDTNTKDSSISSRSEGFNPTEGSSDVYSLNTGINKNDAHSETLSKEDNKSKILEYVTQFEKNEVNVNFESETALCKKCLGNVNFEFKSIESHIEEHKRNPKKRDVGYVPFPCEADMRKHELKSNEDEKLQSPAITSANNEIASEPVTPEAPKNQDNEPLNEGPAEFAKRNNVTYNADNNNAYCRICSTRVPASLRFMKEHVAGNAHRNKLLMNQPRSSTSTHKLSIRKMSMEDYIDEVLNIEHMLFGTLKVVNEKFCLKDSSYHMITMNENKIRCQVCELFRSRSEMLLHLQSNSHKQSFYKVPVIWSIQKEFVREVRPGIFHCGFCNIMEASLEALEIHFQSDEHLINKDVAVNILEQHQPAIAEHKQQRVMAYLANIMLGPRGMFRRY